MISSPSHPALSLALHPYRAWFTCFSGCDERYPLTRLSLRCDRCGGLLDIEHDLDALRQHPASYWRSLLDGRSLRAPWPYQSGVWSKKEWVCPELADADVVSLLEGNTPLLPMPRLGAELGAKELWIKQCGHNHTGSFKDLGMTVLVSMVQHLRRQGVRIPAVACASTGDTSAALAAYAARAGIPAITFLPAGMLSDEQLSQPLSHFAHTVALDTDFDGCMRLVAEFCARHGVYLANSMNPLRIEGQKTLAVEICQQLDWRPPDWVVVPGGNLGHVTAIGKGFELLYHLGLIERIPRLAVAQAAQAAPLYQAYQRGWHFTPVQAQPTQASAIRIGNPVNAPKAIALLQRCAGAVDIASEEEISRAWVRGDRHGLYTDPHTGVALAVTAKLVEKGLIEPRHHVVVVSTAHGLKFGALKREHHLASAAAANAGARNRPLSVAAELPALEEALLPLLAHPGG